MAAKLAVAMVLLMVVHSAGAKAVHLAERLAALMVAEWVEH